MEVPEPCAFARPSCGHLELEHGVKNFDGPAAGSPAITHNNAGAGKSYYIATSLGPQGMAQLLSVLCNDAGVEPIVPSLPAGVEVVRRRKHDTTWTFYINHSKEAVRLRATGQELLTETEVNGNLDLAPGAAVVVRT